MAVASRWNSTVDAAQVACFTIPTSSHKGVVQWSPQGCGQLASVRNAQVPAGQSFPRVINGLHSFSAKVRNTADKPFVSNSSPILTSFHSLITISVEIGSTCTSADPPPDEPGATGTTGWGASRGPVSAPATGVWPSVGRPQGCGGGEEARLPGLPLGAAAAAAWPSLPAGVAGGAATPAGSEPNGICARRVMDPGRDAPKFAKYKIWGPIRNLGPVSESKKRKGKTSQIMWLIFFGAH